MNINLISITGPFTHENLSIFLLRGRDSLDGSCFIPLDEALEQKCVVGKYSDTRKCRRVRIDTRRSLKSVVFDACDHGFNDAALHRNLVQ